MKKRIAIATLAVVAIGVGVFVGCSRGPEKSAIDTATDERNASQAEVELKQAEIDKAKLEEQRQLENTKLEQARIEKEKLQLTVQRENAKKERLQLESKRNAEAKAEEARLQREREVSKQRQREQENKERRAKELADKVEAALQKGKKLLETGDYATAISCFSEAIRLRQDFVPAYTGRAKARLLAGKYDDTISDCDMALLLNSDSAEAYQTRGAAWYAKADIEQKTKDLSKRCIDVAPEVAKSLENAIADCSEALRLTPGCAESYKTRGLAHFVLASRWDRVKKPGFTANYRNAIYDLSQALKIDANTTREVIGSLSAACESLGETHPAVEKVIQNDVQKALLESRKRLEEDPTSIESELKALINDIKNAPAVRIQLKIELVNKVRDVIIEARRMKSRQ